MGEHTSKASSFIDYVITRSKIDKKFSSEIRRSSNPAFEVGGWETLARFNVDLNFKHTRRAYLIVASAAVTSKVDSDGNVGLGKAIALSYADKQNDDQAKARLLRLLSCDSLEDVNGVIRPLLTFVQSRKVKNLNYTKILQQLTSFQFDPEKVKAQWATDFYSYDKQASGVSADES